MTVFDMTGARVGRLMILSGAGQDRHKLALWDCACDCGGKTRVRGADLRSGRTRSCGCLARESSRQCGARSRKHGMTGTAIYSIWAGMVGRCTNPADVAYKDYGGRGIAVCAEWLDFERFYADFGHSRPAGQIDCGYSGGATGADLSDGAR